MTGTDRDGGGGSPGERAAGTDAATGRSTGAGGRTTPRRTFLKAVGAGAVVGAFGAGSTPASAAPGNFVQRDGADLVLGGDPIHLSGSNNFWITNGSSSEANKPRTDRVLELFADMGFDLVRTWTFCEGTGGDQCMHPEPAVHNPDALEHLDYVVAKARQLGMRLVLTFVDNWDHDGGMDQWVEWSDSASTHGDFYTDDQCREWYKTHVDTILTRENTFTGVEYRNEPAIAMWELANEPRCDGDAFEDDNATGHAERADIMAEWFSEMSAYVKDLDPNHLISTGLEGFYGGAGEGGFLYGDWSGQEFIRHHQIDTIDVCSFHMYPYHWDHPPDDPFPLSHGTTWIEEHVTDAHEEIGKPAYLGEFNVNSESESEIETRNQYLRDWYDALDDTDADAATIWQVVLEETEDHDGFQVYRSESGEILEGYVDDTRAKSGPADGSPYANVTAPDRLRIGESGRFGADYSFDPEGSVASYEWDFGDGATGSGENAPHRYTATGEYDVTLTLTDADGNGDSDSATVSVEDVPDDSFVVEGAGETVDDATHEYHFAYREVTGEFTVEAKVATVSATSPDAQAGIAVAENPAGFGPFGAATITPGSGSEVTRAYSDETWRERLEEGHEPPVWLRLERSGSPSEGYEVTGWVSGDGESWTQIKSGAVDQSETASLGLFVSSNAPGTLCTAQFDEVTWLEDWQHADVGDVEVAGYATAGSGGSGRTPTDTGSGDLPPVGDNENAPTDPDGDGLYEDVNGNGDGDLADAVDLFQHRDADEVTSNVDAYDFSGNDEIDLADVVELFQENAD